MATTSERRRHAIKNGYRSGLEDDIAKDLKDRGVEFEYETLRIDYLRPAKKARYPPDFVLPNGIIIETKGTVRINNENCISYRFIICYIIWIKFKIVIIPSIISKIVRTRI